MPVRVRTAKRRPGPGVANQVFQAADEESTSRADDWLRVSMKTSSSKPPPTTTSSGSRPTRRTSSVATAGWLRVQESAALRWTGSFTPKHSSMPYGTRGRHCQAFPSS